MLINALRLYRYRLPLRLTVRHASAARSRAEAVIVEAVGRNGVSGFGEGCPRPYVTGEDPATAAAFFHRYQCSLSADIGGLDDLRGWIAAHKAEIDRNPAAFCAVETAILDLLGKSTDQSIESILGLPALGGDFQYTAVIGDGPDWLFLVQVLRYWRRGFRDFKVKLSGRLRRDRWRLGLLRRFATAIRLDANNLWRDPDQALAHLNALGGGFWAVEEPLAAGDWAGLNTLARHWPGMLILDESLCRPDQLDAVNDPARFVANLRVSKMGGLLRSLDLIRAARDRNMKVIVGAQVGETSLLTRAGLLAARACGDALLAQEGAFGTHLLSRDPAVPCLMFGDGGVLRPDKILAGRPGWGLVLDRRGLEAC